MRKLFSYLKILFEGIEFGIRYLYHVKFEKSDGNPAKYALVSIIPGYPSKVEYFIFDRRNHIIPLLNTTSEEMAYIRYKDWLKDYGKENLVFIKVENLEY